MRTTTDHLVKNLELLTFSPPVTHVYNPLVYARQPWEAYVAKFGQGPREVLLVGMNPGPFGMAQVGVPFGEVRLVREWLGIEAPVDQPPLVHPKRPIHGFQCERSEVSGARLWGWAKERFVTPERFFQRFFVLNYCPLVFMTASGANLTPDKLPKMEREPLFAACDQALLAALQYYQPKFAIGVGHFAESRIRAVALDFPHLVIGRVAHPSPASPAANRGWSALMDAGLQEIGVRVA